MNIYVYNSDTINVYLEEDFGSISSPSSENIDYNYGLESLPEQSPSEVNYSSINYTQKPDFSLTSNTFDSTGIAFNEETYVDNGYIYENSTLVPFGNITVSATQSSSSVAYVPTLEYGSLFGFGVITENVSFTWVGNGTLFEIGNGLERTVSSYLASGTLRMDASVAETALKNRTRSYSGISVPGIVLSGTSSEVFSANTPENTQLFNISGTYSGLQFAVSLNFVPEPFIISGTHTQNVQVYVPSITGFGTATLSGVAGESFSISTNIPEVSQLFNVSGTALESFSTQTPEDTQLFIITGSAEEKDVNLYSGIGTVTISGTAVESFSKQIVSDTQLFSVSGYSIEKFAANPPENTQLFSITGELNHPQIDYTPHYGIDKNIGIGTVGILLTISSKNYSNRYPGPGGGLPDNAGIGTIRLIGDGLTKSLLPFSGQGAVSIVGTANESFSITTYNGLGISTISGVSSTRKISVYGYYGDDNNPGTSGTIFISQQTSSIIEIEVESYTASGSISIVPLDSTTNTSYSYNGFGLVQKLSGSSESYVIKPEEDTILFNLSGSALEVYTAQTPENTILYEFSGERISELITKNYDSESIDVVISGESSTFFIPSYSGSGKVKFISRTSESDYETCDSEEFTVDYQDSAQSSLVSNPPENNVLYDISGSAISYETSLYFYSGFGSKSITGSYSNAKVVKSQSGFGTIFAFSGVLESDSELYIGSGNLFTLSGSSSFYSTQTPESTILVNISGSAETKLEFNYSFESIGGTINIIGSSENSKIGVFTQNGNGNISISGNLVYPDVQFIPSPDGIGTINVIGSSSNSLVKVYESVDGSLFSVSSGDISFVYSTYVGIGTIYFESISGQTVENKYQIPRTYVCII
jgi:hypothetical protein